MIGHLDKLGSIIGGISSFVAAIVAMGALALWKTQLKYPVQAGLINRLKEDFGVLVLDFSQLLTRNVARRMEERMQRRLDTTRSLPEVVKRHQGSMYAKPERLYWADEMQLLKVRLMNLKIITQSNLINFAPCEVSRLNEFIESLSCRFDSVDFSDDANIDCEELIEDVLKIYSKIINQLNCFMGVKPPWEF